MTDFADDFVQGDFARGRRHLLRSAAAWVGAGAALVAARSGRAWQVEEVAPASPLGLALANRCRDPSDHAALVAQLQAQLATEPAVNSLTATCPICGCPVIVSR